jgi:superfamily II DNA or RNA helicase
MVLSLAIGTHLALDLTSAPDDLAVRLRTWANERLSFDNPAYWQAREHRRRCKHIARRIELHGEREGILRLPRGVNLELKRVLRSWQPGIAVEVADARVAPVAVGLRLSIELRDYQKEAIAAAVAGKEGVLVAPTGSGKTVIGLGLVAQLGLRALILVHTRTLLDQTCAAVARCLGVQAGRLGAGDDDVRDVTVATVQTVLRRDPSRLRDAFGVVLLDEAHHAPAATFTDVLQRFAARHRYGLTATPERADQLHPLMYATLGPELWRAQAAAMVRSGSLCAARVVPVTTTFAGGRMHDRSAMITRLCQSRQRNLEIVRTILATRGERALVLSERVQHCEDLVAWLRRERVQARLLVGALPADERAEAVADLVRDGGVLVATTTLVGEGFDCPALDTLYLVVPSGNASRTTQALGRVLRTLPGKAVPHVYDFVDAATPALHRSWHRRLRVYRAHDAEVARPQSVDHLRQISVAPARDLRRQSRDSRSPKRASMHIERTTYPSIYVAFRTYEGPVDGLADAIAPFLAAVRAAGIEPQGPPVALFANAEQDPQAMRARLCVPVERWFSGSPSLRTSTLQAVEVAVARHEGAYRDIGVAYEALSAWLDQQGFSVGEGVSETFVAGPHTGAPEAAWCTEIAVRIKASTSPG